MKLFAWGGIACVLAGHGWADAVVAVRTLPSQTILVESDLQLMPGASPGHYQSLAELVGLETRTVIYPGRPIGADDVGPAARVLRNEIVTITYRRGGLEIAAEGRSLGRAGVGETVRVMNKASKSIIIGRVAGDGTVDVSANGDEH